MIRKWLSALILLLGMALTVALAVTSEAMELDQLIVGDQSGVTWRGIPWGISEVQLSEKTGLKRKPGELHWYFLEDSIRLRGIPLEAEEGYTFRDDCTYSGVGLYFLSEDRVQAEETKDRLFALIRKRFGSSPRIRENLIPELTTEVSIQFFWNLEDGSSISLNYMGPVGVMRDGEIQRGYEIVLILGGGK